MISEPSEPELIADDGAALLVLSHDRVLWVPETRLTLCDLLIFVEETSESVMSADVGVGLALVGERA
jgi:hypothetical protein